MCWQTHARTQRPFGRPAFLCTFDKTYRTAWGTEIILATAGTPFVLNTKSM